MAKTPLDIPWIEPEDVAPAVVFLASDEARMVSGETYDVTGGDSAHYRIAGRAAFDTEDSAMAIEDHPDFPRFSIVSTGFRDAEDRLMTALKSGDKKAVVQAKLALMAALDEYKKAAGAINDDLNS